MNADELQNELKTVGVRKRYIVISEDILCDKNLTDTEKLVYARISAFEEYFESAEQCGEFLGKSERSVKDARRKLERLGYIVCIKNDGRGKTYATQTHEKSKPRHTKKCNSTTRKNVPIDKSLEERIEIKEKEKEKEKETAPVSEQETAKKPKTATETLYKSADLHDFHLFVCDLFGKNPDRIALTDKRKRKLRLRLKELGEERLKQAYIAVSKSAWHRGDNPSGWSIDNKDVYWLVENAERAEEWANKAEDKKRNFNDENVSLQDLREMGLWQ